DADGSIVSYAWVFGDGATGTGVSATHVYPAGSFTARLTVTDNQGATGTATIPITVTAGVALPAAPTNLTAAVGTARQVTLRWTDASNNETGFRIERAAKAKTLQFSEVGTTGANVTSLVRTEAAGTWVYRVRSYNAAGNSAYSNTPSVRVR
ncbi:MAG: PKD domain-containing protein, partial [Vicinamibacterales bacterium]